MVRSNIMNYALVGRDAIVFSKSTLNIKEEVTRIKYKINKEEKEIRLFDVPRILDFEEKSIIYYAILDMFYFKSAIPFLDVKHDYEGIEHYVVKENGYSYHNFNGIEKEDNGILAELLFEIPRQHIEVEKLSRIRDIYDLLSRNISEVGRRPICIAFNGIMSDFKDIYRTILYMFDTHEELKLKKEGLRIFKRSGLFGGNKRIYIVPKDIKKALQEMAEEEKRIEEERKAKAETLIEKMNEEIDARIEGGVKVIEKEKVEDTSKDEVEKLFTRDKEANTMEDIAEQVNKDIDDIIEELNDEIDKAQKDKSTTEQNDEEKK